MAAEGKRERIRAHVWVSGNVQGVYFRAYAEDEAACRGVAGWIRNAPDGRVEVVILVPWQPGNLAHPEGTRQPGTPVCPAFSGIA
jgi:hypothetical protein